MTCCFKESGHDIFILLSKTKTEYYRIKNKKK